jgi:hypothetical protein
LEKILRARLAHPLCALLLAVMTMASAGCATMSMPEPTRRPFDFNKDALAFANELDWIYRKDPVTGKMDFSRVDPEPDYIHHCFVLVRTAKQFFLHARFDAALPRTDEKTYRALIAAVVARSPRDVAPDPQPIVIPGYSDLRSFSGDWAALVKDEAGGSWHSYVQMGNWRMIYPFSRGGQQDTAAQLLTEIRVGWPPVVHLVRFPVITINHAVLLYAATETEKEIQFAVYDPNNPATPGELTYDRASRTFIFPATNYFADGRVDVYEVYHGYLY